MSQLDKFKRRLIRSVARLRVDEKKPEKEVWEILSKEMGCDCGPLWDRMRALTMKKLNRLLACGDCTDTIANVARPSDTDMLMFDLVLVHEDDFDVIGRDLISDKAKDCRALKELFELVQEFSLEETPVAALEETWEEALRYYQAKDNRLTSVTLLQRRWYQLKELTRTNFYKLWHSYRGNAHLWNKARAGCSLTDLQVAVAERYPYVITKPFKKWDELIKAGMVVLPHHIEPEQSDFAVSGNEQDLVLVEPEVETIDLGVDSDSETEHDSCPRDATGQPKSKEVLKRTNEGNAATVEEYNPNITIKTEPPDFDGLSNVKILEATHIPVEHIDNSRQDTIKTEDIDPREALKNDLLRNLSKCIESTDELIKQCDPQEDQSENVQNALNEVENQMENINEPCSSDNVTVDESDIQTSKHNKDEVIQGKADDFFKNKILENMRKFSNNEESTEDIVQRKGGTDGTLCRSNVTEDNIEDSLSSQKLNTVEDVRSSEEEEVLEDLIKQTADDFVKKSKHSRSEQGALTLTDLTIVDDGIDFVDDGIEYKEDNEDMKMEIDADNDSSIGTEKQEDETNSIDLKLLMTPVIITTRLNDMLAFKDREFAVVVDRSIIDLAELESKPKQAVKEPIKEVQVKQDNKCDDDSNSDADYCNNDVIGDDQRVKLTSYLLQKPRSRSYNPIQLCKNPDFNTRLKRLTFGFLSSERNRQFLSACKPATVDLHKAFEDKLVNGTLYLKRSVTTDFVKESSVQKDDQSVRTVSVVPSAMSVQSLIDSSKMKFQPSSTVSSIDLTFDEMAERNKVIHLPDITQVRRINQKLLTAEVPPIRVQNNVTSAIASNYLEVQPVVQNTVVTNKETTGIEQKTNDFNKTSQVINKNTSPLLSNLLVSHRPPSFPKSSINKNAHLHTKESTSALKVSATQKVPEKLNGTPPTNPDKPGGLSFPKSSINKNAHLHTKESTSALKVSATQKVPEKLNGTPPTNSDKPPANPDKPPRKPPTKTIYPYLSWNKPVLLQTRPLDDFLITHDTLLKILAKAKNQPEFIYGSGKSNVSNVFKNSQTGLKDTKGKQKVSDIKKNKQEEGKKIEVIENLKKNTQEDTKKIGVIEDKRDTQRGNITKMKQRVRAKKGIMKTICCWARAWVFKNKGQLLRLPKHMCPLGKCNCCCKHELPPSMSKETYDNSEPIELSDEESDKKLRSVTKIIECVVQQSIQAPVPKLRIYSGDKHNLNEEDTNIDLSSTDSKKNAPRVESVCDYNKVESSIADNTLQDVLIDDESAPVADVQGEVSVVADDIVQKKSICVETSVEKPKKIFVIPEAKMIQMNANNPNVKCNVKPNFQVVSATNQKISTQKQHDFIPPLVSSSVSRKMYVKAFYSKPSRKPPSVSMSTQTMDVPLLQNISIEQEGINKPDVRHQKQLVVDGTRPFATPTTIINRKTDQVIHLKACKLSSGNPLYLGKNQILLTTVKFPSNFESPKKESDRKENALVPKVVPSFPLPEGVEIVLQPNGELACIVKPGAELESTQLSMLPSILESIKQQINTQQPHVISDVINLSDDESEENKNTSKTNRENVLTSVVAQSENVEKSPRKQMVEDIENALTPVVAQTEDVEKSPIKQMVEDTENQETGNEAKLMTQPKNMTPLSIVCNDSLEYREEEINKGNISDNQKSIREETSICQVQGEDTLQSQTGVNNLTKTNENRDDDQPCIKNITMTENKKCEEDKLVDNTNSSTETEAEKKETQENSKHSASSRNLLSDLMEMSGISEEDTKTTPETSMSTLPAVINIDPVNVANEMNHLPDLTPVVSVAQLKYACEQNGKFFKLDFDTGTLVPLSVCIKKKGFNTCKPQSDTVEFAVKETGYGDKVGISANPKGGSPVTSYTGSSATSSTFSERSNSIIVHRYKRNRKNPVFSKPITILRHTRPQSLLRNRLNRKTTAVKRTRKEISQRIEAKIDLVDSDAPMEEEYLVNSESDDDILGTSNVPSDRIEHRRWAANTVTEISDDSSDDEPLALKSKRMRSDLSVPTQAAPETAKNIYEDHEKKLQEFLRIGGKNIANEDVQKEAGPTDADSMELDTDIPEGAILEDIVPEPEEDAAFESESSPEDCILGM